jgi:transposase
VNTIETTVKGDRRRRRRHTDEFKANLLRRWIEQGGQRLPSADSVETTVDIPWDQAKAALVPVQLDATPSPTASDIGIELKRGATTVIVHWPSSAAGASTAWLREILR